MARPLWHVLVLLLAVAHFSFPANAADSEPFTGLLERLPPVPGGAETGVSSADVQADGAAMFETPVAGKPYWLVAWSESAPLPEWNSLLAPSAIYFRRLNEGGGSLQGSPRVLLAESQSATQVEVARGTGGAWVVAHSVTDGLRAWWVPADAAVAVPPPVQVYGGVRSLKFKCASDGTFLWVGLSTPPTSGPDWWASGQQRLAVLELSNGTPALRRISSDGGLPLDFEGTGMIAMNGTLVTFSSAPFFIVNLPIITATGQYSNGLTFWSRNGSLAGRTGIFDTLPWLGILPWSNGEVLAVSAETLSPTTTQRITGRRFTMSGEVPGTQAETLTYSESSGPLMPLREGGVMRTLTGYTLISPTVPPRTLSESGSGTGWRSVDGTPERFISITDGAGRVEAQFHYGTGYGTPITMTQGSGRPARLTAALGDGGPRRFPSSLGWPEPGFIPVPPWDTGYYGLSSSLPVIAWQSAGLYGNPGAGAVGNAAMYQRETGWSRISLPAGDQEISAAASVSGGLGIEPAPELTLLRTEGEDITLYHARRTADATGTELVTSLTALAPGPARQGQPVLVQGISPGSLSPLSAWFVETALDSAGDRISKIRQSRIYAGTAALPETRYVTLAEIQGLHEDGSGQFLWTEDSFIFTARADGYALNPVPAFSGGRVLLAPTLLAGNGTVLVLNENFQPRVYLRGASDWLAANLLTPQPLPDSIAVAGSSVFWLAHEAPGTTLSLLHQSFAGGVPGPVQRIPAGALVPGEIAAAAGLDGRLFVAVLELDGHLPVPTAFMLAEASPNLPGANAQPGLPALRIRQRGAGWADLVWTPGPLFPSHLALLEQSTDLLHWTPIPDADRTRTPASGYSLAIGVPEGFQWTVTHPADLRQVFFRMRANLVP